MRLVTPSSQVKWTALESWKHTDVETGNRSFREFKKAVTRPSKRTYSRSPTARLFSWSKANLSLLVGQGQRNRWQASLRRPKQEILWEQREERESGCVSDSATLFGTTVGKRAALLWVPTRWALL